MTDLHTRPALKVGYDVIILTVSTVERDACLKHLVELKKIELKTHLDDEIEEVSVRVGLFGELSIAVLCVLKPTGNRVSTTLTLAGLRFNPAIIISMGVGGGVPDQPGSVEIGDVVVSNAIADHSQSVELGTETKYNIKSKKVREELEPALEEISDNPSWKDRIRSPKKKKEGNLSEKIIVATISGGGVLAKGDSGPLAQALKTQVPEARAVDMESAAAINVAHQLGLPFVAVRGISDLRVDKESVTDTWTQPWAMAHACAAGFHLIANLQAYILNSRAELETRLCFVGVEGENGSAEATKENVQSLAKRLLEVNSPASLQTLFPKSRQKAKQAFHMCLAFERRVTEKTQSRDIVSLPFTDLVELPERRHLIVGPPGSGKSQLFWSTAHVLLEEGQLIPIYLRLGKYVTWEAVKLAIHRASNGLTLPDLVGDPRICFFLDGWSEFASASSSLEKANLLKELAKSRIIANGKFAREGDSAFKVWELDLLSSDQVITILKEADPQLPNLNEDLKALLTLPLLLSIHILSNASESSMGAVLQRFHESTAQDLPAAFTDALAETLADLTLANENSYNRLAAVLRQYCLDKNVQDGVVILKKLGTIVESDGVAIPVHDLYWDWLAGRGILIKSLEEQALPFMRAREGINLAIQAGEYSRLQPDVNLEEKDVVFAAMLESGRPARRLPSSFKFFVDKLLADSRLAIRNRGGLAALKTGRAEYLLKALEVLQVLVEAKIYSQEWRDAIRPGAILSNLTTVEDWLNGPSAAIIWDEIAAKGGSEWLPALHDLATRGKLDIVTACSTALAVSPTVPGWVAKHFDELLCEAPWKLRSCADRKSNSQLAQLIADDYERFVDIGQAKHGGAFFHLNSVLVACGDDAAFSKLLNSYPSMGEKAREWLGFAITKKGEPWLGRFRRLGKVPHSFDICASNEIDDQTARQWIAAGREDEGWRILISRHGPSILPEVIQAFPTSFANIHHVPALDSLRYYTNTPASVIPEILSRLGSPMMPKAMEECLAAIASVYPQGVPTLVNLLVPNNTLPGYHLAQVLDLYAAWHEKSGLSLAVNTLSGQSTPFPQWLANYAYEKDWEPHFTARVIAKSPEVAIRLLLGPLVSDLDKSEEILQELKNVNTLSLELLTHMLAQPKLTRYIPNVFAICFQDFSNADIEKCLANADIKQYLLLTKLATNSSPKHRSAHFKLIQGLLDQPLEIHKFRQVADMLRCYSEDEVLNLLQSLKTAGENWLWLVREVETSRREFLMHENGELKS